MDDRFNDRIRMVLPAFVVLATAAPWLRVAVNDSYHPSNDVFVDYSLWEMIGVFLDDGGGIGYIFAIVALAVFAVTWFTTSVENNLARAVTGWLATASTLITGITMLAGLRSEYLPGVGVWLTLGACAVGALTATVTKVREPLHWQDLPPIGKDLNQR